MGQGLLLLHVADGTSFLWGAVVGGAGTFQTPPYCVGQMGVCSLGWEGFPPLWWEGNCQAIKSSGLCPERVLGWGGPTQLHKTSEGGLFRLLAPREPGAGGPPILPRKGEKIGGQRGPWAQPCWLCWRLGNKKLEQRWASQSSSSKLDDPGLTRDQ